MGVGYLPTADLVINFTLGEEDREMSIKANTKKGNDFALRLKDES